MKRISSLAWFAFILLTILSYFALSQVNARPRSQVAIADSFGDPFTNPAKVIGYDIHPSFSKDTCFKHPDGSSVDIKDTWHAGEDWFAPVGTPIRAIANGVVRYVHPMERDYPGSVVIVEHTLSDGDLVYSMYGHLQEPPPVNLDQPVINKGDVVGYIIYQEFQGQDNSHLHWEMRDFFDGSFICDNDLIPGPGYTYPEHPDFPITGNFNTGYTNPSAFINYSETTDQVILFQHSYYRGFTFRVFDADFYNLSVLLNDKTSSIVIPSGWRVMAYKNVNKTGGAGEKRTLYFNDVDFSNNQFFDGTPLNDNVSAIEIFVPSPSTCPRHSEGDVDCDGLVTVGDLQHIINVLKGLGSPENTDVFPDGVTTVGDLQVVINTIIGQTQSIQTSAAASATLSISSANVSPEEQGAVTINLNSTPGRAIGSLSLYISFDPTIIDIQSSDISLSDTPFEQWDFQSVPITVSNGLIQIVAFCFNSCTDYSGGSTPVATLNFTAIGSRGSSTDLIFVEDFAANQVNVVGAKNPVANLLQEPGSTTNNGRITISSPIYLPLILKNP